MERELHAKIISCNANSEEVCASAARISTTAGDAHEIFERAVGNPKNRGLIEKVLASGHKSLIEHAVFTIALRDVSVFVEQFLIECRLASFTVKSRRYVDFSHLGYYIPPELEGEDLECYRRYMDGLFEAYGDLLEAGVPREDARFLLPYSFHSNFYCTLNARELGRLLCEIRYGRGREIPELQGLADQLTAQLEERFPCLLPEIRQTPGKRPAVGPLLLRCSSGAPIYLSRREAGAVALLNAPAEPGRLLEAAWSIQHPGGDAPFSLEALLKSSRPRELEQLTYTFTVSNLSLSGLTHLVRHRMQSIVVPPIQSADHSRFIVPDAVAAEPARLERYRRAVETAHDQILRLHEHPALEAYHYYFALSGSLLDVMTTMNARELQWFIRLRCCSRAQWEIRDVAVELLRQLRPGFPELFGRFGPSCFADGRCPEGRLSCGQMDKVVMRFRSLS
ncbi:MAG: FAD-dependent thymidylate synthase [Oscillibacter sp.]|nr:FAD-dependent thymidylate synthase [uncultured Oscillibacter sp.]MCI8970407.1 FAD-dependent thymidylate synthase [Oscillibacter sp.]